MLGSGAADDIKRDVAYLLSGPAFLQAVATVVNNNQDGFVPPLASLTVYQEERLAHYTFPMCELIVYKEVFPDPDDVVKHTEVELGARWTNVARDEHTVTRYVEVLARATVDLLWGEYLRRSSASQVLVHEVDYSPLIPTAVHPFVKSAVVLFQVNTWRT